MTSILKQNSNKLLYTSLNITMASNSLSKPIFVNQIIFLIKVLENASYLIILLS